MSTFHLHHSRQAKGSMLQFSVENLVKQLKRNVTIVSITQGNRFNELIGNRKPYLWSAGSQIKSKNNHKSYYNGQNRSGKCLHQTMMVFFVILLNWFLSSRPSIIACCCFPIPFFNAQVRMQNLRWIYICIYAKRFGQFFSSVRIRALSLLSQNLIESQ